MVPVARQNQYQSRTRWRHAACSRWRLMDEQTVRGRVQELCDALLAGDIGKASQVMSHELQQSLGPIVAMLPLPLTEADIESWETTGTGYRAVLALTGDEGATRLETRWKERDGQPTMVEASHLPDEPVSAAPIGSEEEGEDASGEGSSAR